MFSHITFPLSLSPLLGQVPRSSLSSQAAKAAHSARVARVVRGFWTNPREHFHKQNEILNPPLRGLRGFLARARVRHVFTAHFVQGFFLHTHDKNPRNPRKV